MSDRKLSPVAKELIAARARIADPENWCQGAYRSGHRMCAAGSFMNEDSCGIPTDKLQAVDALSKVAFELYRAPYVRVNDALGHEAILHCFDHAIQQELGKQK